MGESVGLIAVMLWLASLMAALLVPLIELLIWEGWFDWHRLATSAARWRKKSAAMLLID
jgi:hypothetical protein